MNEPPANPSGNAATARPAANLLIVEDEAPFARALSKRLTKAGFQSRTVGTLDHAKQAIAEDTPELILLDMRLPDGSGLDFLEDLQRQSISSAVVVLTAYGELEDAVAAMKLGALDYLKKPIDLDELIVTLDKALQRAELQRQVDYSRKREHHAREGTRLLGDSAPILEIQRQIERIGKLGDATDQPPPTVLVLGETGSGKDLAARLLHISSRRQARPFVHVDCAALPGELIEAELFGHEKGAFTTAHEARTGLIEAAEAGTVFLDELGDLPLELQSKLLAVLERRTLRKVGSSRERPIAAWFIVGTNRPLEEMVASGEFRADLYYRLKVLTLTMPPLRVRGEDILLLARHFAADTAKRYGIAAPDLTPAAEAALQAYHWPGNVRELAHLIERAVLLSGGETLTPGSLALEEAVIDDEDRKAPTSGEVTLDEAEKAMIQQTLERTGGNVSEAARQLGITRMVLRHRISKYGLG